MDVSFTTQSLLPWLDKRASKIYLEIQLLEKSVEGRCREGTPFGFQNFISPFFHLVQGAYVIPGSGSVKDLFILLQKDHCSFSDIDHPLNNPEIDAVWQSAYRTLGEDRCMVEFLDVVTVGETGDRSLPLWQSLFYCEKREKYFHPPCPQCGNPLQLCCNDERLISADLPAYTQSDERFLYCPACHDAGSDGANFYIKKIGGRGQPGVKDYSALLDGFTKLVEKGEAKKDFPCNSCSEQHDCYGKHEFTRRIHPFSFYPFRMFITDAAQLPVREFAALISGASCAELLKRKRFVGNPVLYSSIERMQQQQGDKEHLFFQEGSQSFYEVFYLKLALLEQIARIVFQTDQSCQSQQYQQTGISLDQFWVEFPTYSGILPLWWNFRIKPLSFGIFYGEQTSAIQIPQSLTLYSLALIWFRILLVNSEQTESDVHDALNTIGEQEAKPEGKLFFIDSECESLSAFRPENLFWFAGEQQAPSSAKEIWHQTLELGWSLFELSRKGTEFSDQVFIKKLNSIVRDVKQYMFAVEAVDQALPPEVQETAESVVDADDSEIQQILLTIQEKWKGQTSTTCNMDESKDRVEEEVVDEAQIRDIPEGPELDLEKTVILQADTVAALLSEAGDASGKGEDIKAEKEIDLDKTVFLHGDDLPVHTTGKTKKAETIEDSCEEEKPLKAKPEEKVNCDLDETVIISQEELERLSKGKNGKS